MLIRISNIQILIISALLLLLLLSSSSWRQFEPHRQGGVSSPTRTHVLLLSSWRSGSTFAGQLFSQNPDVFYLMEPAKHVWASMPWGSPELLHGPVRDVLYSVFLCNMEALTSHMKHHSKVSHLFMWPMSRGLCSPPACEAFERSDIVEVKECKAQCGHIPFQKISEACATYSHIVVKAVRVFQMEALYPLLIDPALHLHIIHLVRDPRAVYASRKTVSLLPDDLLISHTLNTTPSTQEIMSRICHSQAEMYLMTLSYMPQALRRRYLLTRYEDLVADPLGHLHKWYHFTGLTSSRRLEAWVYNITHWSTDSHEVEPLAIQKKSQMVSQAWREQLSFQEVQEVQVICREAMEVFGYKQVESEQQQRDLTLDLVLPRRKIKSNAERT
nr:carbohydrate sulfotransferase 5-like [Pogona vitticeps]XP_020670868.1 carbohydrate sulfotransferase 5-like [Pogona vitticeps]XP_020670869.1 carbohydrate sulfotransferase 5-like [Pogona vitticeps]